MFLYDHEKFSIIDPELVNPNNERKRFVIKQEDIKHSASGDGR